MPEDLTNSPIEAENGTERAKHNTPNQSDQGEKIDVRRRKIGAVTIYDVTEAELTILEKGTEASIWLNFFIGTVSVAVSFLVALLTVNWKENELLTQIVFICVTIIMFLAAIACFVLWRNATGQHTETVKMIRERTIQEKN